MPPETDGSHTAQTDTQALATGRACAGAAGRPRAAGPGGHTDGRTRSTERYRSPAAINQLSPRWHRGYGGWVGTAGAPRRRESFGWRSGGTRPGDQDEPGGHSGRAGHGHRQRPDGVRASRRGTTRRPSDAFLSCGARIREYGCELLLFVMTPGCQAATWYSCVRPPRTCFRRTRCSARSICGGRS
jgi:hypothetical protein